MFIIQYIYIYYIPMCMYGNPDTTKRGSSIMTEMAAKVVKAEGVVYIVGRECLPNCGGWEAFGVYIECSNCERCDNNREIFTVCACSVYVYDVYGISKNEDVRSLASVHAAQHIFLGGLDVTLARSFYTSPHYSPWFII